MKTPEDEEFERIGRESGWRKRQIMAEDDDDIQDYKRPWVDLSRNEILEIINAFYKNNASEREVKFARLIQEAAKEKNA